MINLLFFLCPPIRKLIFNVIRAKTHSASSCTDAPPVPPLDSDGPTPVPPPDPLTDPLDDDVITREFDLDASYARPPSPTPSPLIAEGNRTQQGATPGTASNRQSVE